VLLQLSGTTNTKLNNHENNTIPPPPKGKEENTNKPNQVNKTNTNKSYNNNTSHLIRSNPTNETTREQQKIKSSQSRLQIRRKRTENSPEEKSKTEQ
jgi:hypothetical protein